MLSRRVLYILGEFGGGAMAREKKQPKIQHEKKTEEERVEGHTSPLSTLSPTSAPPPEEQKRVAEKRRQRYEGVRGKERDRNALTPGFCERLLQHCLLPLYLRLQELALRDLLVIRHSCVVGGANALLLLPRQTRVLRCFHEAP